MERVRAVQAHLQEEEQALAQAKAEEAKAVDIFKVVMSDHSQLAATVDMRGSQPDVHPPQARPIDRAQLVAAMASNLHTGIVAP